MFTINELDRLRDLIETIEKKTEGSAIIVEGAKDKKALETLGVKTDIFLLNKNKRSLHECAEEVSENHDQAFLFLDLDPKGKQLAAKMQRYLGENKVNVDTKLARRLVFLAGTDKVEGRTSALMQLL